jgi:hypothetical protein
MGTGGLRGGPARILLVSMGSMLTACVSTKGALDCFADALTQDPVCTDGRTWRGSEGDPEYCFEQVNHACQTHPVEDSFRLDINSFVAYGYSDVLREHPLNEDDVRVALTDSLEEMNAVADAIGAAVILSTSPADELTADEEFSFSVDGEYQVGMQPPTPLARSTSIDWAGTSCTPGEPGKPVDCDIGFRSGVLRFKTGEGMSSSGSLVWATEFPNADQLYLRGIWKHEIGHLLGLGHGGIPTSLMYRGGIDVGEFTTETCDDMRAILFLYCDSGSEITCGDRDVAAMSCDAESTP